VQWQKYQDQIDPERLVFIDETWTKTNMATLRGWARAASGSQPKSRTATGRPQPSWPHCATIGSRHMGFDGPIDGESFTIYVEKVLLPTLKPGDIVIMDNLGSHKGKVVRALIRSAGAKLFFLPNIRRSEPLLSRSSPSSSTCCAKPPREPSRPSGPQSVRRSKPSCQRNAPTTSKTQDTPQPNSSRSSTADLKFLPPPAANSSQELQIEKRY